jgi:adenosine kinase
LKTRDVAVTGSVAYDHIMIFPGQFKDHILPDKLHILNVSFLVDGLKRLRGGCAANIAYACALHDMKPRLVASVGSDFGDYRTWLEERGVDTRSALVVDDLLTASCFITTDSQNNQITGFYPGAMARARDVSIRSLPGAKPALVTISPNDPEAMKRYPRECRELGVPFLFDPGQNTIALDARALEDGLKGARAVVMNDYECAMVSEKTGRSVADMLELAEAVIVTLGEKGSRIHARGKAPVEVPAAKPSKIVDPTGCGDAYRGGLVRGIVSGYDWQTCGLLGALTGTYCLEAMGTMGYSFTPEAFAARFEQSFGRACPA